MSKDADVLAIMEGIDFEDACSLLLKSKRHDVTDTISVDWHETCCCWFVYDGPKELWVKRGASKVPQGYRRLGDALRDAMIASRHPEWTPS